jgi:2-oxoglutarate dehydrogenase E2 component (dihydrolipoamide succinyltransferase)
MAIEIRVPSVGESVSEAVLVHWTRSPGEWVEAESTVAVLETDKANVDLPAPASGVLREILHQAGETVKVGEVLGFIDEGAPRPAPSEGAPQKGALADRVAAGQAVAEKGAPGQAAPGSARAPASPLVTPAARRVLAEAGLQAGEVAPGAARVTKEDVLRHLGGQTPPTRPVPPGGEERHLGGQAPPVRPVPPGGEERHLGGQTPPTRPVPPGGEERHLGSQTPPARPVPPGGEQRVPMTALRKRIAQRLVAAQQTAALLTTFNEVDMSAILDLRTRYQEVFQRRHGIRLGLMSFFVKACIEALKEFPQVNARIEGDDIIYHDYYDIGVAVSTERGLVVPVIRRAELLSFAQVEKSVADLAARAREGRLRPEELQGGTFTITNGGVFGSLLSTPIVNPPQSAILGMHKIDERPVARQGQVVIRPMMYLALTYDHRLIDGRESVSFLVRVKECLEDPGRILLET